MTDKTPTDRQQTGMATIRIAALALLLWCGVVVLALVLWSPFPISRSPFLAVLLALFGLAYAVPTIVYITGIDMLARRLRFPGSSVAFTIAVGAWLVTSFVAVRALGGPDMAAFAWICTGACLPGIALFLGRQMKT